MGANPYPLGPGPVEYDPGGLLPLPRPTARVPTVGAAIDPCIYSPNGDTLRKKNPIGFTYNPPTEER